MPGRRAAVPVAAALGNHDYHDERPQEVASVLADAGVEMLEGGATAAGAAAGAAVGADLVVHGHARAGTERGTTSGGVRVRSMAQPVIRRAFAVYYLGGRAAGR